MVLSNMHAAVFLPPPTYLSFWVLLLTYSLLSFSIHSFCPLFRFQAWSCIFCRFGFPFSTSFSPSFPLGFAFCILTPASHPSHHPSHTFSISHSVRTFSFSLFPSLPLFLSSFLFFFHISIFCIHTQQCSISFFTFSDSLGTLSTIFSHTVCLMHLGRIGLWAGSLFAFTFLWPLL